MKQVPRVIRLFGALLLALGIQACAVPRTASQARFFQEQVQPVLRQFCIECHGVKEREAGLDLRTWPGLLRGGSSGPVVAWGDPENSLLFQMVVEEKMPPDGARPRAEHIAILRRWIEQFQGRFGH